MSTNALDEIDPHATAVTVAASPTPAGAATASIAGNTMAVCMNINATIQALPLLADIWACTKTRRHATHNPQQ